MLENPGYTYLEVVRSSREELIPDVECLCTFNPAEVPLTCKYAPAFVAYIDENVVTS